MIGIYGIRNNSNSKIYIGSSVNIEKRWRRHKLELKNKTHSNKYLEKAYYKYGESVFDFILLEVCTKEILLDREMYYIEHYKSLEKEFGYNLLIPRQHATMSSAVEYSKILSEASKGKKPSNYEEMQKLRWKEVEVYVLNVYNTTYPSLREAERILNINRGNVYNYLKGKTTQIKGFENYHFQYKN